MNRNAHFNRTAHWMVIRFSQQVSLIERVFMHEQKGHILIGQLGQAINEFCSYICVRFDNKVTAQHLNAT